MITHVTDVPQHRGWKSLVYSILPLNNKLYKKHDFVISGIKTEAISTFELLLSRLTKKKAKCNLIVNNHGSLTKGC